MRLGLQIPDFTWPGGPAALGGTLRRIARDGEAAGLSSIWVMDHFFQISVIGLPERDMLESYATMAHLAAVTERVQLGTLVTGVTYRHPGLLVKTITTLDVLSGGRAWLGIGAAWNQEEHEGLGVPFPPVAERFERLTQTLEIAHQMWAGDDSAYAGTHYQLSRPLNSPQSLRRPHPPVLVGGWGERKTLRLVAEHADACNLYETDHDTLRHKLAVLQAHCVDVGRPYEEVTRTTLGRLALARPGREGASVEQAVERFTALAGLGFDEAIVSLSDVSEPGAFEAVAQVVERLADVVPAGR